MAHMLFLSRDGLFVLFLINTTQSLIITHLIHFQSVNIELIPRTGIYNNRNKTSTSIKHVKDIELIAIINAVYACIVYLLMDESFQD